MLTWRCQGTPTHSCPHQLTGGRARASHCPLCPETAVTLALFPETSAPPHPALPYPAAEKTRCLPQGATQLRRPGVTLPGVRVGHPWRGDLTQGWAHLNGPCRRVVSVTVVEEKKGEKGGPGEWGLGTETGIC